MKDIFDEIELAGVSAPSNNNSGFIDVKTEHALVGALISDNDLAYQLLDEYPEFKEDVFTDETCSKCYTAIIGLIAKGERANIVTVSYRSGCNQIEVKTFVDACGKKERGEAISYGGVLYDNYLRRKSCEFFQEGLDKIFDPETDVASFVEGLNSSLSSVLDDGMNSTEGDSMSIAKEAAEHVIKVRDLARNGEMGGLTGVPTGFKAEDSFTGGYQNSDLIIVAARPGMGKSAKVTKTMLHCAKNNIAVGMFSLEMTKKQVFLRMVGIDSQVRSEKFRTGRFDSTEEKQVDASIEALSKMPIFIDDRGGASLAYIRRIASKWKRKYNLGLLIIDYIQLMGEGGKKNQNRDTALGEITRGLKSLAKSLDVPILALSQLNRSVETRGGSKRPMMSDIRESGNIEQDADIVQFIYRPAYYGIMENEEGMPLDTLTEIIFAKHRSGGLGTVDIEFKAETITFQDLPIVEPEIESNDITSENFTAPKSSTIPNGYGSSNNVEDGIIPFE